MPSWLHFMVEMRRNPEIPVAYTRITGETANAGWTYAPPAPIRAHRFVMHLERRDPSWPGDEAIHARPLKCALKMNWSSHASL